MMGRKLDLSSLTEEEAEHVLQVVQRDMRLRKTEEERLSELKHSLHEEDNRCVLLTRQRSFNQRCCVRCCSSFTFLLKPRCRCLDCSYNVCKSCCSYSSTDKGWLCSACEKSRLLKTQSLEWFYSNVRRRFRRFGSAKVLKNLYRRHIAEQGSLTELTEGSTYEESVGNDDSVYESDSTFYKHSQEHNMAETISVALRVAEEAIDEAIAKAESQTDKQEKLSEARYLRDNRKELIEELTTTIVQKIIRRKINQSEMQSESNVDWPPDQKHDKNSPTDRPHSALACQTSPKASIWRSRSSLSLLTDEIRQQQNRVQQKQLSCKDCTHELKKDGASAQILPTWKSVDRLDNSMLLSPDGNWTLQSTQLSRPSLLTKRKSMVFSALEKESGVVSAYDGMGSDTEPDTDRTCGTTLSQIRHKTSPSNLQNNLQPSSPQSDLKSPTQPLVDQHQSKASQDTPLSKFRKSPFSFLKRKVPLEYKRSSSQRLSVMDINFNPDGTESSEDGLEDSKVKRTRRKRRSKREDAEEKELTALPSADPDYTRILLDILVKHRNKREGASDLLSDHTMDTTVSDYQSSETGSPDAFVPDSERNHVDNGSLENPLTSTLRELASQVSVTQFSSTEDELDRVEEIIGGASDNTEDGRMGVNVGKEESRDKEERGKQVQEIEETVRQVEENQQCPAMVEENLFIVGSAFEDIGKELELDGQLKTSENLTLAMNDHLHDEKPSKIERTAEACCERTSISEKVADKTDQGKLNDTETKQVEKHSGTEKETKQVPSSGQKHWETNEHQREDDGEERKEPESAAESGEHGVDDTASKICVETRKISCNNQEVEYEDMIDSVAKTVVIMEEETEAHETEMRFNRSGQNNRREDEEEEVAAKEKEMTQDDEEIEHIAVEQDKRNRNEPEETCLKKECDLIKKPEEPTCEADEHVYKDQELNEDLNCALYGQEVFLTPEEIYKKYTAASLRSITTEVLKVLNATEDLIQGTMGDVLEQTEPRDLPSLPPAQSKKLDEQLSRLEENVYVAASAVFGLEAELDELEECARSISGATSEGELAHLEDQVASVAAQVQQSDLQVTDIAARIAALKNAGLNVAPQTRFAKPQTIDSSRQFRRRLPAPPMEDKKD